MKAKFISLAVAATLAGCSTTALQPIDQKVAKVEQETITTTAALRKGSLLEKAPADTIRRVDDVWFPVAKAEKTLSSGIQAQLNREIGVNRRFLSLNEAASYITSLTGIPTTVGTNDQSTSGSGVSNQNMPSVGTSSNGNTSMMSPEMQQFYKPVTYSGNLSGLLDLVGARFNMFWEWEGKGVRFFKTKSRTFRLAALPGDTSLTARVGNQSNSGSGSGQSASTGSSEQRAGIEFSGMSVWKGIEDSIKTMMTKDGRLTVTPATGTLTVDDTPVVLERVAEFVDEQNAALSRQVVINVRVLAVELSSSDEYGINWEAVYQNVGRASGWGLNLATGAAPIANASNLTFNILAGTSSSSNWDGTKAMFEALSKEGKVSQVTSASLVTINNQPAPIQVGRQTSYLASSTTTVGTAGSGNTVSLTPGQVTTGFSMIVLPHILNNQKLMLQYSGDISALTRITTVTSGGSSIQTPDIDTRNFLQRVIMNTGDTLVVTGFEQFNLTSETAGVGDAHNLALGGKLNGARGKTVLVVLIQPVLAGGMKL